MEAYEEEKFVILKRKISSKISQAQFLEAGQEQFDLLVSLKQDLLRLQQLQGCSDNDFDGALDLVEAWLEMEYDSRAPDGITHEGMVLN